MSLEGGLPVFVPYVFRDVSAKPCVIRACGHFLCSVFVPQGSDLGDIGRELRHALFFLFGLRVHVSLSGKTDVVMPQLTLDGLFVQCSMIHKS